MSEEMDFLSQNADGWEGFEEVTAETMSIPFIKLAQSGTPQAKPEKPEYIEGMKPGLYFLTPGDKVLGEEFEFIILKYGRIYIEWLPDRGGFVEYHTPQNAAAIAADKTFGKWKTAKGNDLVEYYTFFGLVVGHEKEGPVILSLTSTGIKVAKNLNRVMTTHIMDNGERALPYYLRFKFTAAYVEKGPYDWFTPKFSLAGYVDKFQYVTAKEQRLTLPDQAVDYTLIEDKSEGFSYDEEESSF